MSELPNEQWGMSIQTLLVCRSSYPTEGELTLLCMSVDSYLQPVVQHTKHENEDVQYRECEDEQSSITFVDHPNVESLFASQLATLLF